MNKNYIYSSLLLTAFLCAGCAKEEENFKLNDGNSSAIELSSVSTDPMTKAVITGTEFTTSEAQAGIGLFLLDNNGNAYGNNAGNVRYAHNDGKWTAASPLRVGGTAGTLVGYYPYSSTVTDITAIPVASSVNGTDYLYGSIAEITSAKAKTESLTLSHALARVSLSFKLDASYVGDGALSAISLSGDCVAASGTLNAKTGGISATASKFSADGLDRTVTKSASTTVECLVVPVAIESGTPEFRIACTIDGKAYATTFTGDLAALASGRQTTIELTVKNTSITVDGSSIGTWGDGGPQTVTVGGDYTVTVKLSNAAEDAGIAGNLIVQCKPDGNSVKVEVCSKTVKPLVIRIGTETRVAPVENGNISTFTISDVTSDITAILAYAKIFKVTGSIVTDVTPAGDYLDNIKFEGLGDYIEGRFTSVTVKITGTAPGYKYTKMVCDSRTVTGGTIVLEDVSKDLEVSALYEFYDYPLPGVFTVDIHGRKVKFARGNMWCQNNVLHNEDEQYQFSGADWENGGHISHFMWSKSLNESVKLQYEEKNATDNDNFFTNAGIDHLSPNPDLIVNGQKGIWRVLSGGENGEWNYLLKRRVTTYGKDTGVENRRYAQVKVNGKEGLLIFPDEFSWPTEAGTEPATFNAAESEWNGVNYKSAAFEALQSAGCVFLPAAGYRVGLDGTTIIYNVGSFGFYWSSTPSDFNNAYRLYFNSGHVGPANYDHRSNAYAVRLVTECQSEPSAE